LHQKAVGARYEKLNFSNSGTLSSIISKDGQSIIESVKLDDYLDTCNPTFNNMDIEGAEMDALKGGRKSIQKSTPLLAVCVYHRQNHLWKIPLLIKSFSQKYRLFLRAHKEDGWDLVCYAIPAGR
jgi:hypothetical protein